MMWKYSTLVLLLVNVSLLIVFCTVNNGYSKDRSLLTDKVNKHSYEKMALQDNVILSKQGCYKE